MKWFWLFCLTCATTFGADKNALFDAANKAYEQKHFAEAATSYQVLRAGGVSSAVLFNSGNAAFKQKQMGHAIARYREAALLAPRDPDIQANLKFVRQTAGVSTAEPIVEKYLETLTLNELAIFTALALWAWFTMLALVQFRPAWKPALSGYTALGGWAFAILAIWLAAASTMILRNKSAVIVVPEAAVRLGPLEESQTSFTLRDGAELQVLASRPGWVQVRSTRPDKSGWVPSSAVELITPGGG